MAVAKTSCKQWSAWKLTERTTERTAVSLGSPCSLWSSCCGYSGHRRVALDVEMEMKTKRKRHQHETKAKRANPIRTENGSKMQPKRSPNAPETKPKRTQNQPNGFKTIQSVPSWLKLAQVLTPRWPMSTPRRPQEGFPNLRFPWGKRQSGPNVPFWTLIE